MASHRRLRRRMAGAKTRSRSRARPANPAPTLAARQSVKAQMSETGLSSPVMIGAQNAPQEKVADQLAGAALHPSALTTQTSSAAMPGASARNMSLPASHIGDFKAPPAAQTSLKQMTGGHGLAPAQQAFFERRLGADLSGVRLHQGAAAHDVSNSLHAEAFTYGRDIGFSKEAPSLSTPAGQQLLAHELSHVALDEGKGPLRRSSDSGEYTEEERRAMHEGRITGTDEGRRRAAAMGLEPGDIVFRLGSANLARMIGDPVTHGGIYIGDGKIHDMVGFGNRDVRVENFFSEAEDASVYRVLRFTGPRSDLIIPHVVSNIRARNFRLPTDSVPWNLFSSADDYRTATCLEYAHAQFLYAIWEITQMPYNAEIAGEIQSAYFRDGEDQPANLIQAQTLTQTGYDLSGAMLPGLIMGAADYLAEDVDDQVFQNRWEGESRTEMMPGAWLSGGFSGGGFGMDSPSYDVPQTRTTHTLRAFTYSSFVNATRFFTLVGSN
ncbi:eCIS core domain-containing protein [Woodsholea maritima]|uniref:eCIS core domain-containing protein n=1 Tax=Woodsholea maritima TaxID=240237 RepID=UPI00036F4B3E|nr:DUF4157 domain-containing protein [Woodsholea maritima]